MDYPFNFTAVIDLLCIVPIIFKFSLLREWLADLLYGQLFTGLYCLRIIRTKRLVTVGRILWDPLEYKLPSVQNLVRNSGEERHAHCLTSTY